MDDILEKVLEIIIKEVDPDMIVLFGSLARGDQKENSDVDLLIIKEDLKGSRNLLKKVYSSLSGIGTPIDMILVDSKKLNDHLNDPYMIYGQALKEGRTLYAKS